MKLSVVPDTCSVEISVQRCYEEPLMLVPEKQLKFSVINCSCTVICVLMEVKSEGCLNVVLKICVVIEKTSYGPQWCLNDEE